MDTVGVRPRSRRPCTVLARAQKVASASHGLSIHAGYLLLHWLALCRYQLLYLVVFRDRLVLSVVPSHAPPEMV